MIKICPDLTSKEEVVPMMVGQGTFTRPVLHVCLQHKCIAYKFGKCLNTIMILNIQKVLMKSRQRKVIKKWNKI